MKPIKDLSGQKFGWLTATAHERVNGVTRWWCDCACGRSVKVQQTNLVSGATLSCGCKRVANNKERALDLTGQVFGRLTAVRIDQERTERGRSGKIIWECACDCGATSYVQANNLRSGQSTTCGAAIHKSIPVDRDEYFNSVLARYKKHAAEKSVSFTISLSEFANLCRMNCHYCGGSGDSAIRNGEGKRNGVDRKDQSVGYEPGNVIASCWTCNRMKGVMSYELFTAQAKKIAEFVK